MTIKEMQERKRELGYSYAQIAELSGVPVGTVQKVLGGITMTPRYDTIMALERVLGERQPMAVRESVSYGTKKQGEYTLEDYYTYPDDVRIELIDGVIYEMSAPTSAHQLIAGFIYSGMTGRWCSRTCSSCATGTRLSTGACTGRRTLSSRCCQTARSGRIPSSS